MKKTITTICACVLMMTIGHDMKAQLLGKLGSIGNIVSSVAGTVYSAPVSLNGNYTYNGVAVGLDGGNILTNVAGAAATATVESKIDGYLANVGIKPGSVKFTFNNADNTFSCNIMNIPLSGTYKVGDGENTVTLTFGKNMKYLSMTGNLKSNLNGCEMLFPADKVLSMLKKVASIAGQASSEISSISKLADNYDHFKLGFKMSK